MIKVLLADDHQMFIDGVKALLKSDSDIEVVGEALNGEKVMLLLEDIEVDIAILDFRMPKLNGLETALQIKQRFPQTKILILTMHQEKEYILKLIEAGVGGYVLKHKSSEELLMAIHNVYKGFSHFALEILNVAAIAKNEKKIEAEFTPREKEVLCLIAEGFSTKDISQKLFIAEPTVNTHRRNLLQKLEVPNTQHLVRYAIRKGWVEP